MSGLSGKIALPERGRAIHFPLNLDVEPGRDGALAMDCFSLVAGIAGLVGAGQISGVVQNLHGEPLQGVRMTNSLGMVYSSRQGAWSLGAPAGMTRKAKSLPRGSTSLVLHDRRLRISWSGHGVDGRWSPLVGNVGDRSFALRSAEGEEDVPDTLTLFAGDKRLARLEIPRHDTTGVVLRIDTAWRDDDGFVWNPHVDYGSLRDPRDNAVYRTVRIGDQTWMAEGLRYVVKEDGPGWPEFQRLRDAFPTLRPDDRWGLLYHVRGLPAEGTDICPEGWRFPTFGDVSRLVTNVFRARAGSANTADDFDSQYRYLGKVLRAKTGWPDGGQGTDQYGFRLLPSGEHSFSFQDELGNELFGRREILEQGRSGAFWIQGHSVDSPTSPGEFRVGDFEETPYPDLDRTKVMSAPYASGGATIRCIQN